GLEGVPEGLYVVADEDVDRRGDLEALPGAGEARAEGVVEALRVDEDRQPAVRDLGGEGDVLRADRREEDRNVRPERPEHQLQRLPEPGGADAVVRDPVVLALVLDRLAAERGADDLDVFARLPERLAPWLAVPALDHLRAGGAEAEDEAAARHQVEGRGGHRGVRGRASRDLHD